MKTTEIEPIAVNGGPIMTNYKNTCLWCGVKITEENDSGWEAFTGEDGITQKICVDCDERQHSVERKMNQPCDRGTGCGGITCEQCDKINEEEP